jgi:hypothetical protein
MLSSHAPRRQEGTIMKVMVKAEKAGRIIAQAEFEVENEKKAPKGAAKALRQLQQVNPDLGLFDDDVRIKFDKAQ